MKLKIFTWFVIFLFSSFTIVFADDTAFPAYLLSASSLVSKAELVAKEINAFDDVLIAQNYIRNAEAEYKKHLSWTGKLEPAAEPTVRYFATMAELQAKLVLSHSAKAENLRQIQKITADIGVIKNKIKVFDDKNEEIAGLKKGITELNNEKLSLKNDKEQLIAKVLLLENSITNTGSSLKTTEQKATTLSDEVQRCTVALKASEKKVVELTAELAQQNKLGQEILAAKNSEIGTLKQEIKALSAAKGISEAESNKRIETLKRQKEFVSKVAQLGGVAKPGSENMAVIFSRSSIIKSPKNDKLTLEGQNLVNSVTALLTSYTEYRIKVKVHGFGSPAKHEDAAATDRMARLIREAVLVKGKFQPERVEALGIGTAEPVYPKKNLEANRRVELIFLKQ